MRRLAITILIAPFVGLAGLSLLSPPAHASTPPTTSDSGNADATDASQLAPVDVLQVSGIFDKIVVRSIVGCPPLTLVAWHLELANKQKPVARTRSSMRTASVICLEDMMCRAD